MMQMSGSCSVHGTLRRQHSSTAFNTTLEDDVFDDSLCAPNSAKPLLDHSAGLKYGRQSHFPHLSNGTNYCKIEIPQPLNGISDPLDSSSSSRSRSNPPMPRKALIHSSSTYQVGHGMGGSRTPGGATFRVPSNYADQMRKRTRSTSSGFYIAAYNDDPDTPTPPPLPPTDYDRPSGSGGVDSRSLPRAPSRHAKYYWPSESTAGPHNLGGGIATSRSGFYSTKYNGYLRSSMDYHHGGGTGSESPPLTPSLPPPPPPPVVAASSQTSLKHLGSFGSNPNVNGFKKI